MAPFGLAERRDTVYPSILHCYADHKWTGPSEPVVRLCAELSARGWRSDLACMTAPDGRESRLAARAREAGLECMELFRPHGTLGLGEAVKARGRLLKAVRTGCYGLVHCHGSRDQFVAVLARRGLAVPLVRTDHAAREYGRGWLGRSFYGPRKLDHLIVLSERYAVQAVDRLGRPPESVTVVRGAVDVQAFRPVSPPEGMRAALGMAEDDVVVGVVARVQSHRRFEVLLEAAARVRRQNPAVKIAVCGRGTHKGRILDRPVERMGLKGTVLLLGYRGEDYAETLATFDAGLMLVPGSDGSCRAALQMAAMGKPLIVAARGVLPDIVRDGETGIVVDDTPERLARALLEMAAHRDRRQAWGVAARQRMSDLFTPARQAQQVIAIYRRLLGAS